MNVVSSCEVSSAFLFWVVFVVLVVHCFFGGVATNICVETSLRDATCADYFATLVEDCSGAYEKKLHDGTVQNVASNFGLVVTSEEILSHWK